MKISRNVKMVETTAIIYIIHCEYCTLLELASRLLLNYRYPKRKSIFTFKGVKITPL